MAAWSYDTRHRSPYTSFSRVAWAQLRAAVPLPLAEADLDQLQGITEHVSLVVLAALACESILAGAALDQLIVQLPARQKVGTAAYAAYLRATDAANGCVLYPIVGVLSNATTIGAFVLALWLRAPLLESTLLGVAAASGVAAFLVTRQAIPVMSQLAAGGADDSAGPLVDRLVGNARSRAPLFFLIFACLLATLVAR